MWCHFYFKSGGSKEPEIPIGAEMVPLIKSLQAPILDAEFRVKKKKIPDMVNLMLGPTPTGVKFDNIPYKRIEFILSGLHFQYVDPTVDFHFSHSREA